MAGDTNIGTTPICHLGEGNQTERPTLCSLCDLEDAYRSSRLSQNEHAPVAQTVNGMVSRWC